jgi:hypothetical protein
MYDKLKNVGKIVYNSYGPTIYNRGNLAFFLNRGKGCLISQVRKSILK